MDPNNSSLDHHDEYPDFDTYTDPNWRVDAYIVLVVHGVILLVGLVGNIAVIVVYARHGVMRTTVNAYLVNIAVAHLLFIILILPLKETVQFLYSFPFSLAVCKILHTFSDLFIGAPAFTLVALTGHMTLHQGASTIVVLPSIWTLALVCAVPTMILSKLHHYSDETEPLFTFCYMSFEWVNIVINLLVHYVIPLCLIAGMYLWQALKRAQNVPNEMRKIVVVLTIMFAVCFLPYHTSTLLFDILPSIIEDYSGHFYVFRIVGFCLNFASACVNPVALYCMSGAFRKHFNQYLMFWRSGSFWTGIR